MFFFYEVVAGTAVDFLKEIHGGNVIQMRKQFTFGGQEWEKYKGPKSLVPFQVSGLTCKFYAKKYPY